MDDITMMVTNEEAFEYLVELRDTGETNMYGAVPYLMREFAVTKNVGKELLFAWFATFE